jgi:hypothetical protein
VWNADDAVYELRHQPADLLETCILMAGLGGGGLWWCYSSVHNTGIPLQPMSSLSVQNVFLLEDRALKLK